MDTNEIIDDFTNEPKDYVLASRGKRFTNYIIDVICFYICFFILGVVLAVVGYDFSLLENMNGILERIITAFILAFFYIIMESTLNGKTPGKYITKTRAVKIDGTSMDFETTIIRSFSRIVPFEPFSFFGDEPVRGWHDRWSDTKVIDETQTYAVKA